MEGIGCVAAGAILLSDPVANTIGPFQPGENAVGQGELARLGIKLLFTQIGLSTVLLQYTTMSIVTLARSFEAPEYLTVGSALLTSSA